MRSNIPKALGRGQEGLSLLTVSHFVQQPFPLPNVAN